MTQPLRYGAPITLAQATEVAAAAEAEATREGWPMVIAVVDSAGHLVLLRKMDDAQTGSIVVAQQKAKTSVDFKRPTAAFESVVAQGGLHLRLLGMTNVIPLEGGVPLVWKGKLIGAIGVSGMQSTQDAQVAQAGADTLDSAAASD